MKDADVKIGMKVVPHNKTAFMCGLGSSGNWQQAKRDHQPYLFVNGHDEDGWMLGNKIKTGGDYFNASDFEPYEDLDRRITEAERELAQLIAERDAKKLLPVGAEVWVRGEIFEVDPTDGANCHYKVKTYGCPAIWIRDANIKEVE